MDSTLQNALENHLNDLNAFINKHAKYILDQFYLFIDKDFFLFSLHKARNYINRRKGKDGKHYTTDDYNSLYYVYYSYLSFFKIIWISVCIIMLLLMVLYVKKSCSNVVSDDMFTRLLESLQCHNFMMLALIFIIITLSYIFGGYIRLIGIISFVIISIIISFKPENIHTLTNSVQEAYTNIKDVSTQIRQNTNTTDTTDTINTINTTATV